MKDNINFRQSQLYKQILEGKLTHTIMLISSDDELLDAYAKNIVSTAFCQSEEKPCGNCSACLKIEHGNMVDVLTFPKDGEVLKSGELTSMLDGVFELPFENDKKFYILNNFSNTDVLIQNKLLKTLEEPPAHAYFILKVKNETNVLQTIKSRCQKIFLPKLNGDSLAEVLKSNTEPQLLEEAIAFCDGSIALAKEYVNNPNFLKDVNFVFDLLKNYKKSWQMVDFASKLYDKKDEILDIIHIYLKVLQDTTYVILGLDDLLTLKNHKTELELIGSEFSVDALTAMIKHTNVMVEKIDRNCNFNTIIDEFLLNILEVKHKWPV